jgi:hypothetical protein
LSEDAGAEPAASTTDPCGCPLRSQGDDPPNLGTTVPREAAGVFDGGELGSIRKADVEKRPV